MEYISLYAKKEFLSDLSKQELKAVFQLFRIMNSFNYNINKIKEIQSREKSLHNIFYLLEETFTLAALIKESMKVVFKENSAASRILPRITDREILSLYSQRKAYYDTFETNVDLKFIEKIRNDFAFHFKEEIYDGQIGDGKTVDDLHIAVSFSEKNGDILYLNPTNSILDQIRRYLEKNKIDRMPEKYLYDVVSEVGIDIYTLVNKLLREIFKNNAYKKMEEF